MGQRGLYLWLKGTDLFRQKVQIPFSARYRYLSRQGTDTFCVKVQIPFEERYRPLSTESSGRFSESPRRFSVCSGHFADSPAAFRALSDLAAFDPNVDVRRLEVRLAACAVDAAAAPAARVMAIQLCGERKVAASRPAIASIAAAAEAPTPLRLAATHALSLLD